MHSYVVHVYIIMKVANKSIHNILLLYNRPIIPYGEVFSSLRSDCKIRGLLLPLNLIFPILISLSSNNNLVASVQESFNYI